MLLCPLQYSIEYSRQYLYFKSRMSGSKSKSSGDVFGSTALFKVLYWNSESVVFIFCFLFFLCIISVKSIVNLLQYSIIHLIVLVECLSQLC